MPLDGDTKSERHQAAVLAIQQMIKQKSEVGSVSGEDYVEAPETPSAEDQQESGASHRQIEERIKKMATSAAAGFNTTGMGIGMRDLGFAISKSRGDVEQKDGTGRLNVKAIAKRAETVVARKKYSLLELQTNKNLPGVAPHEREQYLNDEDFVLAFGMEREQFERLPPWKQKNMKQAANLF